MGLFSSKFLRIIRQRVSAAGFSSWVIAPGGTMNPEIDRIFWFAEGVRRYGHYALGGLAALCLLSGNYVPLMESATQRYLESEGKALWQLEERATIARTALQQVVAEVEQAIRDAEERRRLREEAARRALEEQQRAEAERQRLAQSQSDYQQAYAQSRAEFDGIVRRYYTGLSMTLAEIVKFEAALTNEVRKPGFLDGKSFTMGEISTPVACSNPDSFDKLFVEAWT